MTRIEFIQQFVIHSDSELAVRKAENAANLIERCGYMFDPEDRSVSRSLHRIHEQLDAIRANLIRLRSVDGENECSLATLTTAVYSAGTEISEMLNLIQENQKNGSQE